MHSSDAKTQLTAGPDFGPFYSFPAAIGPCMSAYGEGGGSLSRRYTNVGKLSKTDFGGVAPQSEISPFPYMGGYAGKNIQVVGNLMKQTLAISALVPPQAQACLGMSGGYHCLDSQNAGNCLKRVLNPTFKNQKIFPYKNFSQLAVTLESQHVALQGPFFHTLIMGNFGNS